MGAMVLLGLLSGCSGYDVSINDNVVYTPKPLLQDYQVADENLARCIKQTISDHKITRVADLTQLRCTHAGIKTLAGIDTFYALKQLDVGDNAISGVKPLATLGRLEVALLDNNQITRTEPLLRLIKLVELNLEGNPVADCDNVALLQHATQDNNGVLSSPASCKAAQ
jgi:Leucine-rich repeat (LRR) protein